MNPTEIIAAVVVAALSGGLIGRVFDRMWQTKDKGEKESVAVKQLNMDDHARIREEQREEIARLKAELNQSERNEASWRIKYWENLGQKQATETELHTLRPRFIDVIQQNQALIAENETLKIREGRRIEDKADGFQRATEKALDRIEAAGVKAVRHTENVAKELAKSQGRADDVIEGVPGEASDAASKSGHKEE